MAFCTKCGTQVSDEVKFCPSCGGEIGAATQPPTGAPPATGAYGAQGTQQADNSTTMAILTYILFFIPILTGAHRTSEFVKYHTNQGTILFIVAAAWGIISDIIRRILRIIPIFGGLIASVLSFASLVFLALCIMGILNAKNGKETPLPVIGGYTIIK